ncbi:Hypothetical protein PBC10988_11300 [Planctomycetales bacterium 10988]|nr:Hypothetical protein PBC10988_11300 [Planctomycetales bacterium 10988]
MRQLIGVLFLGFIGCSQSNPEYLDAPDEDIRLESSSPSAYSPEETMGEQVYFPPTADQSHPQQAYPSSPSATSWESEQRNLSKSSAFDEALQAGTAALQAGNAQAAIASFTEALGEEGPLADAYFNRCSAYLLNQNYRMAAKDRCRAVQFDPSLEAWAPSYVMLFELPADLALTPSERDQHLSTLEKRFRALSQYRAHLYWLNERQLQVEILGKNSTSPLLVRQLVEQKGLISLQCPAITGSETPERDHQSETPSFLLPKALLEPCKFLPDFASWKKKTTSEGTLISLQSEPFQLSGSSQTELHFLRHVDQGSLLALNCLPSVSKAIDNWLQQKSADPWEKRPLAVMLMMDEQVLAAGKFLPFASSQPFYLLSEGKTSEELEILAAIVASGPTATALHCLHEESLLIEIDSVPPEATTVENTLSYSGL